MLETQQAQANAETPQRKLAILRASLQMVAATTSQRALLVARLVGEPTQTLRQPKK